MVIVGGTFEVAPEQREAFLAARHAVMRASRAEAGCLDYVFSADPLEPGRVILFERWESQDHLDTHLARVRGGGGPAADATVPTAVSVVFYDATAQTPPA